MGTKSPRGPYSKGIARRAEILRVALDAYAASGPQGPSLKSIAAAAGLTEAGVLHYFDSKDELLVAILAARDDEYAATFDLTTLDGVWAALAHTTKTPGLLKLFVDITAAATSPDHPGHAYMRQRADRVLALVARLLGPGRGWHARVLLAAAEGLQVQWLRDPSTDIVADLRQLRSALERDAQLPAEPAPRRA
ncbi:TetR/AcrR family transcriptional regulator [Dactylosporangium darangshiense]|uniref:TetR/AcrR family transcriptional regulator n=1 Tax=Dactylosporangium darangshiense TaxID=579108 RepID=A0ABP8DU64_9ACTN